MFKILYPLLMLFGLFLNITSFSQKANISKTHFKKDTSQYAIIKFNKTNSWIFKNVKATTLTLSEIELIKSILKTAIIEHNKTIKNNLFAIRPQADYKIQIVSILNRKGEKVVWVNCLCDGKGNKWRTEIIIVEDGGNWYFNLKINLTKKTFYQMLVNGYA